MRSILVNCYRVSLVLVQSALKVQTLREEIWDQPPFPSALPSANQCANHLQLVEDCNVLYLVENQA